MKISLFLVVCRHFCKKCQHFTSKMSTFFGKIMTSNGFMLQNIRCWHFNYYWCFLVIKMLENVVLTTYNVLSQKYQHLKVKYQKCCQFVIVILIHHLTNVGSWCSNVDNVVVKLSPRRSFDNDALPSLVYMCEIRIKYILIGMDIKLRESIIAVRSRLRRSWLVNPGYDVLIEKLENFM